MRSKILAIFLCLGMCFTLAACGDSGGEEAPKPAADAEGAAGVSNGTLEEDSTAVSVGKTKVPYREYKIYYYFMKTPYENILTPDVWTKSGDGGSSIGQAAIEDVLRLIIQVKIICREAADENVTLAADEKEEADYNAKKYCESLSDKVKKDNSITLPVLTQIFEENKLAEKMYNIVTGKVDSNISPGQAKAARVQLIYLKANDDNRQEIKQKAEKLCAKIQASDKSFYTFAKANTEASEIECLVGRMDNRSKLANTIAKMKKHVISDVIEERDGFYIAYCVQPGNKQINSEYKNQIVEGRQTEAFQSAYQKWSEKYEVKVSKSLLAD